MTDIQYCSECIHFSNETQEDWFNGDYHMWTELSCDMGNEIDDLGMMITPFNPPCEDYEEEVL